MTSDTQSNPPENSKRLISSRLIRRLILIPLVAIMGLFFLSFTATPPSNLGVVNGRLADCPESPNCVSTTSGLESQKMAPVKFDGDPESMLVKVKQTVADKFPRAKLITEDDLYLHYEFTTLAFRFVDDVEFLINDNNSSLHFRSASRVGHSDLGTNRKRMTKICESL